MEYNTLYSNELEEMRSQIGLLKQKLERQTIINDTHIRNSMKSKMSALNRTVGATICAGIFAAIFSPTYFYMMNFSLTCLANTIQKEIVNFIKFTTLI